MRVSRTALAGILALCAAGASFAAEGSAMPQNVGVEVDVQPAESPAGAYLCRATVTDLRSGEVLSAPQVAFPAGEEAQLRTGTSPGAEVLIRVTVAADGSRATYTAEVRSEGRTVSSHKASVQLRKP
jgi:hypothetical protein